MSLSDRCLVDIATNLEDYSINELSLLPRSLRQELLTRLPIPDLCNFEKTPLSEGVNMEEVWYAKCLLDVNVYPAENSQEKSPVSRAEHDSRREWDSSFMSCFLPTDSERKSWREYYFCSKFGLLYGMVNFTDLREMEQAMYYIPQRLEHARYLIEYAKKNIHDCCCDNEKVVFLRQGFIIPPRYLHEKYKRETLATLREDITLLFMQFTKEHPQRIDIPMIPSTHNRFMLGPERDLALSNLRTLEYDIEMQCRLKNPEEDDFAKHLEIISSVQRSKPVLHTLELRSASGDSVKDGSFFRSQKAAVIETDALIKATSTQAYLNLQWLRIGGGIIEPYIAFLLPLIEKQPNLHSLEIIYDISKERLALSAKSLQLIYDFFKRPHFQRLGLAGLKLPAEFFCTIIREFLSNSADQKTMLYILETEITGDTALIKTSNSDSPTSSESSDPLAPKSLSIKYLYTDLPALWSDHILPALSSTAALNLEVFDIANCNISDPSKMISVLAYHSNLALEVVNISDIALPDDNECCKALEDLFQNHPSIQEFHANHCGLGKPSLLTSLTKAFSNNSAGLKMRVLTITKNELSNRSNQELSSFFAAICSLPQLSEVGLSYNGLLPEHAELLRNAWRTSDHSKFSILSWRFAPPKLSVQSWPPLVEPKDKRLNRTTLRDACWKLLL